MKAVYIKDNFGSDRIHLYDDSDPQAKENPWFAAMFDNVEITRDEKGYPISMRGNERQYSSTSFFMPRRILKEKDKERFLDSSYEPVPWYYFSKGYRGTIKYNGWRWVMAKKRTPRMLSLVDKLLIDPMED